ncbi:hypothetical protein [Microvirga calopogonii]|uniref:hypothetical protein n=1 Tax=Microvirga calopogonii TaxID=2078013 RepID=UPI000E0D6554|nr:hypothetical protein [Microvirga calopogonii]
MFAPAPTKDNEPEMLDASDTLARAAGKLAAGNVGAACVLGRIVDDPFTGALILLDIESMGLRGEEIWLLYSDVHAMDLGRFIEDVKVQARKASRFRDWS